MSSTVPTPHVIPCPLDRARAVLRADASTRREGLAGALDDLDARFGELDHRMVALEEARRVAEIRGATAVVDDLAKMIDDVALQLQEVDALFVACTTAAEPDASAKASRAHDREALLLKDAAAVSAIAALPAILAVLRRILDTVAVADGAARSFADRHGHLPRLAARQSAEIVALRIVASLFATDSAVAL